MTNLYLKKRKRLLKRFILLAILFIFAFFVYALLRFVAFRLFRYDFSSHDIVILGLSVFLVSIVYKPIDHLVLLFFKDVFFKSNTMDRFALIHLGRALTGILDRTELANLIVNTFGEALQVRTASVLIYEQSKGVYQIESAFGLKSSVWRHIELSPHCLLIELLRTHKAPIERERVVHSFSWQEANQLLHDCEKLHASCIIPLIFQDELIGSINLTPRTVGKPFSPHEIKSFFEFAWEAAAAFRNTALFDELRQSNRELMKIQSEFLHSSQHSAIAQLATGIAHEIHNPLTIISGKAQILLLKRDKIAYGEQVEEVLKTIVKQTKRAADITRKLLMFSESHRAVKEPIDFEAIVNDTVALLSYQVSLDQIQVIKHFERPIPKWFGNVGELREAFLNLFLNAVQAIGTHGSIQVSLSYQKQDQMIELKVSDSGPGIPEADISKIFQPFFTTRQGASGLGLFVAQQIIYGYHGMIRAENRFGEGAVFTVDLPCCVVQPTTGSENQPKAELEEGNPSGEQRYSGGADAFANVER